MRATVSFTVGTIHVYCLCLSKSGHVEVPVSHRTWILFNHPPALFPRSISSTAPSHLSNHPIFSLKHSWPSPAVGVFSTQSLSHRDFSFSASPLCVSASLLYSFLYVSRAQCQGWPSIETVAFALCVYCCPTSFSFSQAIPTCHVLMTQRERDPRHFKNLDLRVTVCLLEMLLTFRHFFQTVLCDRVQQKRSRRRYILLL